MANMPRHPPSRRPPASRAPSHHHAERPRDPGPWLYGRHAVAAALANRDRRVRRLVGLPESAAELRQMAAAAAATLPAGAPEILERVQFAALLPADAVHQGMALAAEPLPARDIDDVLDGIADAPPPHIVVLLDQVSDPHNVGAIVRSAAAFAVRAVVMTEHGAPPVTGA